MTAEGLIIAQFPIGDRPSLEAVAANIPGIILQRVLRVDGSIGYTYIAGALEEIYGLRPEEVLADPARFLDTLLPEDRERFFASLRRSAAGLTRWSHVFRIVDRSGRTRWMEGTGSPLRRDNGDIVWDSLLLDVTERRAAELALHESESRFQNLARVSPVGIFRTDPEGDCVYANERWCGIAGLAPAEALGAGWARALHPDDRERVASEWYAAAGAGKPFATECRFLRPDGGETWLKVQSAAEYDIEGRITGHVGTITDITDRRRAEEELERRVEERTRALTREIAEREAAEGVSRTLKRAVEHSASMVVITDAEARIEYVNPKFTEVTGYAPAEVAGCNPRILGTGEKAPSEYAEMWRTIHAGGEWRGEFRNRRKDGSIFWVAASISAMRSPDGAITHFIAVEEDVTERKRSERELEAAKEMAEAANRAKSQFLAHMSHELRTPLNAIIGFSDAIRSSIFGAACDERSRSYIEDIYSSGVYLLDLINDILDLAKVEAGEMPLAEEEMWLAEVVDECLAVLRDKAAAAQVSLLPDISKNLPPLHADPRRIKQILLNLLSNAVKFTPEGGSVSIGVHRSRAGLAIRVADTGIGIAATDISKVLEPFGQVDSPQARKHQSTGLGLPLTRKFAELHGGSLFIESEPGQGTTVTVTLPAWRMDERGEH